MENLMNELTTATPIVNTFLAIAIGLTSFYAIKRTNNFSLTVLG